MGEEGSTLYADMRGGGRTHCRTNVNVSVNTLPCQCGCVLGEHIAGQSVCVWGTHCHANVSMYGGNTVHANVSVGVSQEAPALDGVLLVAERKISCL